MAASKLLRDSISKSSAEYQETLYCEPCLTTEKEVNAVGYCSDCMENLCKDCFSYHPTIKVCKDHKLLAEPRSVICCKPCAKRLRKVRASGFCLDCRDSLCEQCYDYHPRPSALRLHRLVKKPEISDEEYIAMIVLDHLKEEPNLSTPPLSEENIDLCAPCLTKNAKLEAGRQCSTCKENLCDKCQNYHSTITVFEKHKISWPKICWCKPCARKGQRVKPNGYCNSCEESLCLKCYDYHPRTHASRNHKLFVDEYGKRPY